MKSGTYTLIATMDWSGWMFLIIGMLMSWCKQPGLAPICAIALGVFLVSASNFYKRMNGEEIHTCLRENIFSDVGWIVVCGGILLTALPALYFSTFHTQSQVQTITAVQTQPAKSAIHKTPVRHAKTADKHTVSRSATKRAARAHQKT